MAKNTPENRVRSSRKPPGLRGKYWLIGSAVLALLIVAGFFGFQHYRRNQQQRVVERAQSFLDQKDGLHAILTLRHGLQKNPGDVAAHRMMAEILEKAGSKQAMLWRRTLAEKEPNLANFLAWAGACILFGEPIVGEQALASVNEAGKKTAAYQHMAGRVALALNQVERAGNAFAEAVRLEPANEQYQLDLAALRLLAGDAEARLTLERLAENPTLGRRAQRALCQEAIKKNDAATALRIALQLQSATDAPYEDRLLYLSLLRQLRHREFDGYLLDLQERSLGNPNQLAMLIAWLNRNKLAMLAVEWGKRLPSEVRNQLPIPSVLAESYANLRDWKGVKDLAAESDWQELEFMRRALLARALREEGDLLASKGEWNGAVRATGNAPESLAKLAQFATASKWAGEATDILWSVAKGKSNPQWALAALWQENLLSHNTVALLDIASRKLELDPQNPAIQHNVATLSLLLNSNADSLLNSKIERALVLAGEAYRNSGNNPDYAATYAYSLHFQGKTEEALTLMRSLPEKIRESPGSALYFAIILVDHGDGKEAAKFLELAQGSIYLPEEHDLMAKTKASLARMDASIKDRR